MNSEQWQQRSKKYIMNTYGRFPVVMVDGSGCLLRDTDGREYLDFVAGIAVCNLGHCYDPFVRAVREQTERLIHVSNLYHTQPQTELAEMLVENSFADKVFFANSGAEANEAAIKLARKYGGPGRYEIISLTGSFHGRTLATVAATGQKKFHKGFEPLPAGFLHARFSGSDPDADLAAIRELISPTTCAVMMEPVQGEGGVRPLSQSFLAAARELCDQHNILLIFDEVQVGMGRCGTLFGYQISGVEPDIMTLAKGLGNGLPIGATLAREKVAAAFSPGDHASTFGGNPVASAGALVVIKTLLEPGFLQDVQQKGRYLAEKLAGLAKKYPQIVAGVRGCGLLQGLVLTEEYVASGPAIVNSMFQRGVLINFAGNIALRFIPPLIVTTDQINTLITELASVLAQLRPE